MSPPDPSIEPPPSTMRPELAFTPAPSPEEGPEKKREETDRLARDRILKLLQLARGSNGAQIEKPGPLPEDIRQLRENKDQGKFSPHGETGARRVCSVRETLFGSRLETLEMTVRQKLEMWAKLFKERRKRMSEAVGLISLNVAGALDVLTGVKPPLKIAPPVPA